MEGSTRSRLLLMRKKLVVGNWKMNLTVPESTVLIEKLKKEVAKLKGVEIAICPSFLAIYSASKELADGEMALGAQDLFYEEEGAYTGAVSPVVLSHFVKYALVGHSERRKHFSESDKVVAKKAAAAVAHDITPIICVGETLHEKQDGLGRLVVMSQLETDLSQLTASEVAEAVVAYEPVWAIGTGHVCKPTDAEKMANDIRMLIKALYGDEASKGVRILYGGSVTDENAADFVKLKQVDGVLVGGASLDHKKFATIAKEFNKKGDK